MMERVQNLRIEEAKRLLETSGGASLEEIGPEVGYESAAFFRRLFKRHTGLTTAEYRRMFHSISLAADSKDEREAVEGHARAN